MSGQFHKHERQIGAEGKEGIRANELALVTTEWSFSGTESDGKQVHMWKIWQFADHYMKS
jgi:hypothetical protein